MKSWKVVFKLPKSMGHCKSSSKREVYSDIGLTKETRKKSQRNKKKVSKKQSNLTPKRPRKKITKPKVCKMKEIIKIRVEINKIETKKQQKRSMKAKAESWKI